MAKEKAVINQYDGHFPTDRYESKYFKFLGDYRESGEGILKAFKTKDIDNIERAIKNLTNSMKSHIFFIGLGCVIIDREGLYADAGYRSYLEYARHLYEATGLSPQSISAAKIIIERFIDYNQELKRHGFDLEQNSNKLLYLENALENHESRSDVFKHVSNDTFREFVVYARTSDDERPEGLPAPKIKVEGGKILVNGRNILNFPDSLPDTEREAIGKYLADVYAIRAAGNEPLVVEAYDASEARVLKNRIDKLLKEIRSSR